MTEPDFVLSDSQTTTTARGRVRSYPHLDAARAARGRPVVGAISFDPQAPDSLWEPAELEHQPTAATAPAASEPAVTARCVNHHPEPAEHRERVAGVVAEIRAGAIGKVVLGRAETLALNPPVPAAAALEGFRCTDAAGNGYLVDLGEQGHLVGSSPELLVARHGHVVTAFPLAGTRARRPGTAMVDDPAAAELLDSAKDLAEHRFVTDALRRALDPYCIHLDVPERPELVATPGTWHLGTAVRGELRGGDLTVLDLVALVHPTPALCGSPYAAAMEIIRRVEGPAARGWFGGAVGWCDAAGDGEFRVTIRGALLDPGGSRATVWAGGGITADSDPDAELAETTTKLGRARQGLCAAAVAGVGA